MTYPDLTSLDELGAVLKKHGIEPSRSLGQNFLICPEVVETTVSLVAAGAENVTELGPGVGTLTQGLVGAGLRIRVIEKDDDFVKILPKVLPPKMRENVQIVHGDLRRENWEWDIAYQLVGNIPYNLSGLIIRRVTQLQNVPEQVVLLVQKEVGERLVVTPPNMNLLGLSVALWGEAQMIMNVPASCFHPSPKVDSQLMLLIPSKTAVSVVEREAVLRCAKVFFQQKRKQIGGVMRRSFDVSDTAQDTLLSTTGLRAEMRPQEISVEQWQQLANLL